ncbi:MAG: hydrolase TatD, partial [Actinomycetota bacterium]
SILQQYGTERMLVNSAADWGRSDPLKVKKTADAMLAAGFDQADVDTVVWDNPVAVYGQSGRLELDGGPADPNALFEGSSIKRGGS